MSLPNGSCHYGIYYINPFHSFTTLSTHYAYPIILFKNNINSKNNYICIVGKTRRNFVSLVENFTAVLVKNGDSTDIKHFFHFSLIESVYTPAIDKIITMKNAWA